MAEIQRFRLVRVDAHTTTAGNASAVLHWRSDCADCGTSYKFRSGLTTANFYRRCKGCRTGRKLGGWTHGPRIQHSLIPFIPENPDDEEAYTPAKLPGHLGLSVAEFKLWMDQARAAIPDEEDRDATRDARRAWIDARLAEEVSEIDPASLF